MQFAEIVLPDQMPVHVVTVQTFRAKKRDDILAVGRRGAVGMRGLEMPLDFGFADMRIFGPQDVAGIELQANNLPTPLSCVLCRLAGSTRPASFQRRFVGFRVDCRRQEYTITPYDRS